jgi:aspartate 1-decarboxylase
MMIEMMQSKIHRAVVSECNLNYEGSIGVDENLLIASNILPNQKVDVLNINNGERFSTYVIKEPKGSGTICINGAGARKAQKNDLVIIVAYSFFDESESKTHIAKVIKVNNKNKIIK